ncbi:MAG: lipopolysaccharide heptosyltransferase II, partial [Pseudomonadota bacterium]
MSDREQSVLVVGPSWVGDMVMSQVLYIYLKQIRPGINIDVLAPAWSNPLLKRMPQVRRAITMPLGHGQLGFRSRWRLGRELRSRHYDQAILLPNSFKSALVPFFAGVSRRTGWRGEYRFGLLNDMRTLDKKALPLMAQRFMALGHAAGDCLPATLPIPSIEANTQRAKLLLDKFHMASDRPLLALCPGSEFGSAKRWPVTHYAQLGEHYLQRGWQVALLGSGSDQTVTGKIRERLIHYNACFDLAGQTQLDEVIDLLSRAHAVVSNDSGLMHIAAALGLPLAVIYGPTSAEFTPP